MSDFEFYQEHQEELYIVNKNPDSIVDTGSTLKEGDIVSLSFLYFENFMLIRNVSTDKIIPTKYYKELKECFDEITSAYEKESERE